MNGRHRVVLGIALALTLAAAAPGAAQAAFAPTVAANMVDEGVADGWRTIRVDVTSSCGPEAPADTVSSVQADLVGLWRGSQTRTFSPESDHVQYVSPAEGEQVPGPAATYRFRVTGGVRVAAIGYVSCSSETEYEGRDAKTAPTGSLLAPPRLDGFEFEGISYTGGPRCAPRSERAFQVGPMFGLRWLVDLEERSAFGRRMLTVASVGQIKLHVQGAGRKRWDHSASRRGFRAVGGIVSGFYFRPRTRQPVKLWVTVGGLDSNVLTVPVRRRVRGC